MAEEERKELADLVGLSIKSSRFVYNRKAIEITLSDGTTLITIHDEPIKIKEFKNDRYY